MVVLKLENVKESLGCFAKCRFLTFILPSPNLIQSSTIAASHR